MSYTLFNASLPNFLSCIDDKHVIKEGNGFYNIVEEVSPDNIIATLHPKYNEQIELLFEIFKVSKGE